jgi:iron complex transport system permease protein
VALCGVIGFVGLVVPHMLRLAGGADNRFLLPASALGGAVLLCLADTLARTVAAPAEIPIGVITALCGAPVFLYLLVRRKRSLQFA